MRSIRLLPIVIFAAAALLVFKGIGLLTSGGYVITGTTAVVAAGAHSESEGDASPAPTLSGEPTLTDTNPTLTDTAPTMSASVPPAEGNSHAVEAALGGPAPLAASDPAAPEAVTAPGAHATESEVAEIGCPEPGQQANTRQIGAAIADATKGKEVSAGCPPEDARREAAPATQDSRGNEVPLDAADGTPETETEVLERLSERRAELDARAEELSMREALVAAAEKRIDERTAALETLEKQIDAMVADKKAMEEAGFKSLIAMYEGMKPADAAAIFNDLDLRVLLRLARGMNPRKMAPIMAAMVPARAQELTMHMADAEIATTTAPQPGDLASLPQIVGQ